MYIHWVTISCRDVMSTSGVRVESWQKRARAWTRRGKSLKTNSSCRENATWPRFRKIQSFIGWRTTKPTRPNAQYCSAASPAGSGKPRLAAPAVRSEANCGLAQNRALAGAPKRLPRGLESVSVGWRWLRDPKTWTCPMRLSLVLLKRRWVLKSWITMVGTSYCCLVQW